MAKSHVRTLAPHALACLGNLFLSILEGCAIAGPGPKIRSSRLRVFRTSLHTVFGCLYLLQFFTVAH